MDKEIDKIKNACILLRNARGYILCVQLNNGKWTIPGGKINKGEKKWHAAVREFKEETGNYLPDLRLENKEFTSYDYHGHTRIYIGQTNQPDLVFNSYATNGETINLAYINPKDIFNGKIEFVDYSLRSIREIYYFYNIQIGGNKTLYKFINLKL